MNRFLPTNTPIIIFLSTLLIASCGGGGGGDNGGLTGITYDGNTSPAAIDATNAEAIGTAAGESVQKAGSSTGLPLGVAIDNSVDMDKINNIVLAAANRANLPAGIDMSDEFCTSGSVDGTDPGNAQSGPVDVTVTFSNCKLIGDPIILDGVAKAHFDDIGDPNTGFSFRYQNFKVTDTTNGQTTTINLTIDCTDSFNCTLNSDFVGSDDVIHRITEFSSMFGNAVDGFYGSATFYHGIFGRVSVTFDSITYGSCGVIPDGGTITYESNDTSFGSITFNPDCSTSGTWTDADGNTDSWPIPTT